MHINRLEIENFKGISKLEIEPSKINLFVGRNNTCKSTILEGAILAGTAEYGYMDALNENILEHLIESKSNLKYWIKKDADYAIIKYNKNGIDNSIIFNYVKKGIPSEYDDICRELIMKNVRRRADIEYRRRIIRYAKRKIIEKASDEYSSEYEMFIKDLFEERYQDLYNREKLFLKQELHDMTTLIYENLRSVVKHSFDIDTVSNLFYYSWSYRLSILELYNKIAPQMKLIKDILKQIGLYDIRPIEDTLYVYESEEDEPIPVVFMGDGFKTILKITILSQLVKDGILVLEEPEATLHPGYIELTAEHLVKAARENDTQLFISTHSSEFIRSMLDYAEDDIRIFRMHKRGDNIGYTIFEGEDAARKVKDIEIDLRGI